MATPQRVPKGMEHQYFNSSVGVRALSNLSRASVPLCPGQIPAALLAYKPELATWITGETWFPSVEQLWQGLKALDRDTFLRFTSGGDFGLWTPGFFLRTIVPGKLPKYAKKNKKRVLDITDTEKAELASDAMKRWMRFNMIGVLAKIAANPEYGDALALGPSKMAYNREFLAPEVEEAIWLALLHLKYSNNVMARKALLDTGATYLIEFDKGAGRHHKHWGALVDKIDGRTIHGDNVMGKYMVKTRSLFQQE